MTRDELHAELASLPGATLSYPFDAVTSVYKVGGKMFALVSDDADPPSVNLKCDPDTAEELREQYPGVVTPGYHMSKRHWNTVTLRDGSVEDDDLRDWIAHSHDLVLRSLPKAARAEVEALSRDGDGTQTGPAAPTD